MIRLEQKGFTLVEMLISIGILGIVAPLLAVALFQILTFTERGRAGFEAQADTRNASAWVSQDIVMAQQTSLVVINVLPDPPDLMSADDPLCSSPVGFSWTDYYDDRNTDYTVSYCWKNDDDPLDPEAECPPASPCLVRNFQVFDSDGNLTSDGSNVVARNIASVTFEAVTPREINVTIKSAPIARRRNPDGTMSFMANRFGVEDEKTFKVQMRPTIDLS